VPAPTARAIPGGNERCISKAAEESMPILDVEIVTPAGEEIDDSLASRLADAAGEVFGSVAGQTWVRLRPLPSESYAENGGGPPDGVSPVFVGVLLADPPVGEELRSQVHRLTLAIANACGRPPENVHLFYRAAARGRVAFGGKLVGGSES
jgi:phenylpyruvate tautomerase PptA (4-oxalocrotonate tautomerase family)